MKGSCQGGQGCKIVRRQYAVLHYRCLQATCAHYAWEADVAPRTYACVSATKQAYPNVLQTAELRIRPSGLPARSHEMSDPMQSVTNLPYHNPKATHLGMHPQGTRASNRSVNPCLSQQALVVLHRSRGTPLRMQRTCPWQLQPWDI